jgi:hypothetical protein
VVTGFFSDARSKDGAFTSLVTATKLRGWKIHASQEDDVQAAYGFPDWLLYALWDEEFYYVVNLDAPT